MVKLFTNPLKNSGSYKTIVTLSQRLLQRVSAKTGCDRTNLTVSVRYLPYISGRRRFLKIKNSLICVHIFSNQINIHFNYTSPCRKCQAIFIFPLHPVLFCPQFRRKALPQFPLSVLQRSATVPAPKPKALL